LRAGLLVVPQNIHNGFIQGVYPTFKVQIGDHFRSRVGCENNATDCYVVFRLEYQVDSSDIYTFWAFVEKYDGENHPIDIDLSSLAGKDVKFILTVLSAGPASDDRAFWVDPVIYRTNTSLAPVSTSDSTLKGQVFAKKPVTISLYRLDESLVVTSIPDSEGRFNFTVPLGSYLLRVTSGGSLSAQNSITLLSEESPEMPTITLPSGDIDGNNIIDQFDAMTIGMNYNGFSPTAADLNNDGTINLLDLQLLAANYQRSGPIPWQ
jgi:hypothetical protein